MTNATLECLETRRSIRKYQKIQIKEEELQAILEAGIYAPNGAGRQSPVIVVAQDPEMVAKLSKMNAAVAGINADPFYGAPTVAVVLADKTAAPTWMEDAALVAGNILNAAHSVGVDSCYIYRAKEMFSSEEGLELLKEWGLNENYVGVANCILGYRDCEYPEPAPRKENYIIRA